MARHPAARGLADDAAVLDIGETRLVLTHDMLVEGIHFLSEDPAEDVAWKLLSVNLSDLAAKGAKPVGVLMGYGLTGNAEWDNGFLKGLKVALSHYDVPLLGGDTVKQPASDARALGLTAIGSCALESPPARSGAQAGDHLYVTGPIGNGWAGLQLLLEGKNVPAPLIASYRRPQALVETGQKLAPHVHAMMDISDGLLIDAQRMAGASGLSLSIALDSVPLSEDFKRAFGDSEAAHINAATGGDDYQLLFAAPANLDLPVPAVAVGKFAAGKGLSVTFGGGTIALPEKLGYAH